MKFKRGESFSIKFSATPPQIDVIKVATSAEQLERIRERAKKLREAMGTRYVFHEQNRVRRIERTQNRRFKAESEEAVTQSTARSAPFAKCV